MFFGAIKILDRVTVHLGNFFPPEDYLSLDRISHRMARLSRRALDLQGIFWASGITVFCQVQIVPVDSKSMREFVIPVRNAGWYQ